MIDSEQVYLRSPNSLSIWVLDAFHHQVLFHPLVKIQMYWPPRSESRTEEDRDSRA